MKQPILLVGAGVMAEAYAKVLQNLKKSFVVIGRGQESAQIFKENTGISPNSEGLDNFLKNNQQIPQTAIVAVTEDQLGIVTLKLLSSGVKSILVEKPGGFDELEIKQINQLSKKLNTKVFVGYNRRFYESVRIAQEIIKQDGGATSFFFDFTEASFKVSALKIDQHIKQNWFLHNSTHVIDLAFFLGGDPKEICTYTKGKLPWHSKAAIFCGAGITKDNILFSYIANWDAPGRWAVEIMTKKHKLIFKPLEKLQVQEIGSFEIKEIPLSDKLDKDFKPGIYKQVQSFLGSERSSHLSDKKDLCTIDEQVNNLAIYKKMLR